MNSKQWHQCHVCCRSRRVQHEVRVLENDKTVHICMDCAKKEKEMARDRTKLERWTAGVTKGGE